MSRQSHLSANDKGENELKPGAVHRSPGIYLTAEKEKKKKKKGTGNSVRKPSYDMLWDQSLLQMDSLFSK